MTGFAQTLSHCHAFEYKLSHQQRMELKHLYLQVQTLRSPSFPHAAKGLEGMLVADQLLKEKGRSGILIGGLAEAMWNYRRKPEDLLQHKDVDVMIQGDPGCGLERFEGGIDWWLPEEEDVAVFDESSGKKESRRFNYWINGNGVILSFGLHHTCYVEEYKGLLIPNVEWIVDMRSTEASAQVDSAVILDQGVLDGFEKKVRRRMGTCVPQFLRGKFNVSVDRGLIDYSGSLYSLSLKERAAIAGVEAPVLVDQDHSIQNGG